MADQCSIECIEVSKVFFSGTVDVGVTGSTTETACTGTITCTPDLTTATCTVMPQPDQPGCDLVVKVAASVVVNYVCSGGGSGSVTLSGVTPNLCIVYSQSPTPFGVIPTPSCTVYAVEACNLTLSGTTITGTADVCGLVKYTSLVEMQVFSLGPCVEGPAATLPACEQFVP